MLLDFDVDEVRVSQAIIAQSRSVVLAADRGKIGRPAPVRIADMTAIDHFVTDVLADEALRNACARAGTRMVETGQ